MRDTARILLFSGFRFQANHPMRALALGCWHDSIVAEHGQVHHLLADVAKALNPLVWVGRQDFCGSRGGLASGPHGAALEVLAAFVVVNPRAAFRGQTNGGVNRTRCVTSYRRISAIGGEMKRIGSNKWSELVATGPASPPTGCQ